MKRILFLMGLVASVAALHADDEHFSTLKVGSEVYSNVTVTSVTPTHVYFSHSRGVGSAKLKDLAPDLQKQFHYDAATASAADAQRYQANAAYRQALMAPPAPAPTRQSPPQPAVAQRPPQGNDVIPPHPIYAKSFLNQPAPTFVVEKWLTPQPDTQGKFVLVDFWATWCPPCRRSIPHLNTLYGMFRKQMVVVGVSAETEYEVRRMTTPLISYPIAIDTRQRMERALEVKGIPHAILIDPQGIVRFEGMPQYLDHDNLAALLDQYGK